MVSGHRSLREPPALGLQTSSAITRSALAMDRVLAIVLVLGMDRALVIVLVSAIERALATVLVLEIVPVLAIVPAPVTAP